MRRRRIDHDQVLDMWAQGMTCPQIAEAIGGRSPATVWWVIRDARENGDARAAMRNTPAKRWRHLRQQAALRGVSVEVLSRRVLEAIDGDKLVPAILDDGIGAAP